MDDNISNFNYLRLKDKKLFLSLSCEKSCSKDKFLDFVASSLNGGVNIISFCQNNLSTGKFVELAQKIRQLTSLYNAIFLIHSRVDIAQIVEADGVYLSNDDLDISLVKPLVDEYFIFVKQENDDFLMLNNDKNFSFKIIKKEAEINKIDEILKSFHGIMMSDKFFSYENISEALKIVKDKHYAR